MKCDKIHKTREKPVNRHFTALYELGQKLRCNNKRLLLTIDMSIISNVSAKYNDVHKWIIKFITLIERIE